MKNKKFKKVDRQKFRNSLQRIRIYDMLNADGNSAKIVDDKYVKAENSFVANSLNTVSESIFDVDYINTYKSRLMSKLDKNIDDSCDVALGVFSGTALKIGTPADYLGMLLKSIKPTLSDVKNNSMYKMIDAICDMLVKYFDIFVDIIDGVISSLVALLRQLNDLIDMVQEILNLIINGVFDCIKDLIYAALGNLVQIMEPTDQFDFLFEITKDCPCIEEFFRNKFKCCENASDLREMINCIIGVGITPQDIQDIIMHATGAMTNSVDAIRKYILRVLNSFYELVFYKVRELTKTIVRIIFYNKYPVPINSDFDCWFVAEKTQKYGKTIYRMTIYDMIITMRNWQKCMNTMCAFISDDINEYLNNLESLLPVFGADLYKRACSYDVFYNIASTKMDISPEIASYIRKNKSDFNSPRQIFDNIYESFKVDMNQISDQFLEKGKGFSEKILSSNLFDINNCDDSDDSTSNGVKNVGVDANPVVSDIDYIREDTQATQSSYTGGVKSLLKYSEKDLMKFCSNLSKHSGSYDLIKSVFDRYIEWISNYQISQAHASIIVSHKDVSISSNTTRVSRNKITSVVVTNNQSDISEDNIYLKNIGGYVESEDFFRQVYGMV